MTTEAEARAAKRDAEIADRVTAEFWLWLAFTADPRYHESDRARAMYRLQAVWRRQ